MIILEPEWSDGAPFIERALALNPGDAQAYFQRGRLNLMRGEPDCAIADCRTAQRLDPLSDRIRIGTAVTIAFAGFQLGQFATAAMLKDVVVEIGSPVGLTLVAAALGHLGDVENASRALARYREQTGGASVSPPPVFRRPEHIKMFEDGIAIAEGRTPPPGKVG